MRQALSDLPSGGTITFNIPTSDPGYNSASGVYTIALSTVGDNTFGPSALRRPPRRDEAREPAAGSPYPDDQFAGVAAWCQEPRDPDQGDRETGGLPQMMKTIEFKVTGEQPIHCASCE